MLYLFRARVALSCVKPITSSPRSLKLAASTSKRYEGALLELSIYHKLMPIDRKEELLDVKTEFQSVEVSYMQLSTNRACK